MQARQLFVGIATVLVAEARLPTYDEAIARRYMHYARISFCDDRSITRWHCGVDCDNVTTIPGTVSVREGKESRVKAYVGAVADFEGPLPGWFPVIGRRYHPRQCIVAFRGSVNLDNWFTDAKAWQVDWPEAANETWCQGCKVHHGFATAWRELREFVRSGLQRLHCTSVSITGHSLGGAIATMACMDIRGYGGFRVEGLWTYGSPRVGNTAFAKAFVDLAKALRAEVPSWRVVHYHDPVPHLAPRSLYHHVPYQVFYADRESTYFEVCAEDPYNETGNKSNTSAHGDDGDEGFENSTCGVISFYDIADGVLHNDHVYYFNNTFRHKALQPECVKFNGCREAGYHLRSKTAETMIFLLGVLTGASALWFGMRARRRCNRSGEQDGRGDSVDSERGSMHVELAESDRKSASTFAYCNPTGEDRRLSPQLRDHLSFT